MGELHPEQRAVHRVHVIIATAHVASQRAVGAHEGVERVGEHPPDALRHLCHGTLGRHARRELMQREKEKHRARQRLEEKMKPLEGEKSAILAYYFENPTDYAPTKAQRLSEINEELAQIEREWLALV